MLFEIQLKIENKYNFKNLKLIEINVQNHCLHFQTINSNCYKTYSNRKDYQIKIQLFALNSMQTRLLSNANSEDRSLFCDIIVKDLYSLKGYFNISYYKSYIKGNDIGYLEITLCSNDNIIYTELTNETVINEEKSHLS